MRSKGILFRIKKQILPAWRLANLAAKTIPPRNPATTPNAANEMCAQSGSRKQPAMSKLVEKFDPVTLTMKSFVLRRTYSPPTETRPSYLFERF